MAKKGRRMRVSTMQEMITMIKVDVAMKMIEAIKARNRKARMERAR